MKTQKKHNYVDKARNNSNSRAHYIIAIASNTFSDDFVNIMQFS